MKKELLEQFDRDGYVVIENVLSPEFAARSKKELEQAIEEEAQFHKTKDYKDYGMVLMCSGYGGTFVELLDNKALLDPFNSVLGSGCIIYAYTSSSMPPSKGNYSTRIHVDCPRIIPGYITNVGATILLDDFTEDNGATWFLPRSQNQKDPPSEADFYANARRLLGKAGTVWYFNARVWHAGGENRTDKWRHALTINMCRPWMKQRIDIPRAMSAQNLSGVPETALQKLGFLAQVPASYEEYYQPPEKRKFRQPVE